MKKRILIVNCYFNEFRFSIRQRMKMPQTMAPAYLAGMFSRKCCEIKLHDEVYSSWLEDERLLGWPDMLVLTGLNASFDRMLQLTAYTRTKNPKVIVVAGGPVIRMLTKYSKNFFDYCCIGDIEQLQEVIEDALGKEYISETFLEKGWVVPRYDLAYWMKTLGYVESSRSCYFTCNFCSLTAEGAEYQQYDIRYLEEQFNAMGKHRLVFFLDNNFGCQKREFLFKRLELLKELREKKYFGRWGALVTGDFFLKEENLELVREAGCISLFTGVESFDKESLVQMEKYQNTRLSQVAMIQRCLDAGIVLQYGVIFDLSCRTIAQLREELELMMATPQIPLPSFITLAIPLMGTGFFYKCLEGKCFLPNVKIRDLDGTTLILKPLDPIHKAVQFVKELQNVYGYKRKVLRHSQAFLRYYSGNLNLTRRILSLYGTFLISMPKFANAKSDFLNIIRKGSSNHKRTHLCYTEPLDSVYTPAFPVDSCYEKYFKPTMLTDNEGNLCEELQPDFFFDVPGRAKREQARTQLFPSVA